MAASAAALASAGSPLLGPSMTRAVFASLPEHDASLGDISSPSTLLLQRAAHRRGWKSRTLDPLLKLSVILLPDPDGGNSVWSIVLRNTRTELGSSTGNAIAEDRWAMQVLGTQYGFAVPAATEFTTREAAHAWLGARAKGGIVVTPARRHVVGGTTVGVTTPEELDGALDRALCCVRGTGEGDESTAVAASLSCEPNAAGRVLLVEYIPGDEYRVLVVGGRLVAAAKLLPAFVTGDGTASLRELIAAKNADARRADDHPSPMTSIDADAAAAFLRRRAAQQRPGPSTADPAAAAAATVVNPDPLAAVPSPGTHVMLSASARLGHGGEVHDVTERVHPAVLEMAETWARVTGMGVVGVDIKAGPDIAEPPSVSMPRVISLNAAPTLQVHAHPTVGQRRDVAGAILDEVVRRRRLLLGRPAHPRWTVCVQRQRSAPSLRRFRDILLERRGADGLPQWCISRNPRAAPNLLLGWRDRFSYDWLDDCSEEARAVRRAAAAQADAGAYLAAKRRVPRLTNFAPWYRRLTKLQLMRVLEALAEKRKAATSDDKAAEEVLAIAPKSFWLRSRTVNRGRGLLEKAVAARQTADGTDGIWIVKPAAGNKGSGIVIKTTLAGVIEYVDTAEERAEQERAAVLKKELRVLEQGAAFRGEDVDHLNRPLDTDGVPVIAVPTALSVEEEEALAEAAARAVAAEAGPSENARSGGARTPGGGGDGGGGGATDGGGDGAAAAPVHDFVVQSYLENPLLVEGYKFDMRVYALVDPWLRLHIFTDNMLKLSATPFTMDPASFEDRFIHLTNHCIAVESPSYGAVTPTNELTFPQFDAWLRKNVPGRSVEGDVLPALTQMLRVVGDALEPYMRTRPADSSTYCFQRLGMDVMLDDNFRAVLLEVNTNPGGSPELVNRLLRSEIELVVDPLFPPYRTTRGSVWTGTSKDQLAAAATAAGARADNVEHPVPPPAKEPKLFRLVHDYGPQVATREAAEAVAVSAAAESVATAPRALVGQ